MMAFSTLCRGLQLIVFVVMPPIAALHCFIVRQLGAPLEGVQLVQCIGLCVCVADGDNK